VELCREMVSGNIFIRKNGGMKRGDVVKTHKHNFDHTTIVFTGSVHVKATFPDGKVMEDDFKSPEHFLVGAQVLHEITALEDGTEFWCVYSHRTPQGDIVQTSHGWREAYL
jgi:hypothetical protein